ncbi:MAG: hypothetical protein EAZ42_12220 [Verrucomicrobia bacterium]|nr:MAG: hypothetical protein EAZ42_12220 [Verrucomicrobiota bacterium]
MPSVDFLLVKVKGKRPPFNHLKIKSQQSSIGNSSLATWVLPTLSLHPSNTNQQSFQKAWLFLYFGNPEKPAPQRSERRRSPIHDH